MGAHVVRYMLSVKADPNIHRDSPEKHNTLIYAACKGKIECAELLINHGDLADETLANKGFFEKDADGQFSPLADKAQKALILAARNGYPDCLISLISSVKKEAVDSETHWRIERNINS